MNLTPPDRFQFVSTEDGSPTLRFVAPDGLASEPMHNLMGAFSETDYIYGDALRVLKEEKTRAQILSLGLGLGYNEILSAASLVGEPQAHVAQIDSYEIDPDLRAYFAQWIESRDIPNEFQDSYDQILTRSAAVFGCKPGEVKDLLRVLLKSGNLRLLGAMNFATEFDRKYNCFLFDAFSSKTSPELWMEEFLVRFFSTTSTDRSVFSTYACTGVLKRSLKAAGFEVKIRKGFSSKRDSTFAHKK